MPTNRMIGMKALFPPNLSKLNHFFLESKKGLTLVLCLSLALKFLLRLVELGKTNFWSTGYSFYYEMAVNFLNHNEFFIASRHGLYAASKLYALRPPLYPLFIAATGRWSGFSAPFFILAEALISTLTVILVYRLALDCFDSKTAFFSALLYAFYPYSVVHDTQLQENVLYNLLSLFSILCLILGINRKRKYFFFLGGVGLGLATLTRTSHLFHSAWLILLTACLLRKNARLLHSTGLILLGLLLTLSPWCLRNKRLLGSLTVTTITGGTLAEAHNPFTFRYYPYRGSIDQSTALFRDDLEKNKPAEMQNLYGREMAQNHWYRLLGLHYAAAHKMETVFRGVQKMAVNFLGILSPLQSPLKNISYFASYWLLTLLMLMNIRNLEENLFFYFFVTLCLSQAVFSFIFWAHTSHRSFLDPLLAIAAGSGISLVLSKPARKNS